ncbi:hypothetical protein BN982_02310 [Halobacillus karajensis]|uniref:Uncharacterized protein n=2 Tax=Halobacillus karajensis TaxID=195088 RepID=A0A024P359_9BACI|nr:hypothetical protein BN982_02310 [Halobacillus karajensis]CDQ22463.1 hypothetical protein BN983_00671 [Halobacillus karajensis]CDQ28306.1 hypothetical protein BN981_02600 [Halobacillus karajensis]
MKSKVMAPFSMVAHAQAAGWLYSRSSWVFHKPDSRVPVLPLLLSLLSPMEYLRFMSFLKR